MKYLIWTVATFIATLSFFQIANAAITFPVNGGTGSSTLSGILVGNGTSPINTLILGTNLSLTGTTLNATGGGFSTTSAIYFLSVNQGNAFSTTSANAWGLTKGYLTSNAGDWAGTWQTFSPSHFQVAGSYLTADPFWVFQNNAVSTSTPVLITASTTIGNGTQAGGLTVNGGATTTGNALVSGNLTLSNITTGSILFGGASGLVSQDNSNFTYTPSAKRLDINGPIRFGTGAYFIGNTGNGFVINNHADTTNLIQFYPSGCGAIGTDYAGNGTDCGTNNFIVEGRIGIATSTPGSVLSVQGVANFTTATSTFYGNGLNLTSGCYAINGACISGGGGGSSASSTLLTDNNTFSGVDSFTNASSNFSGTWQTFSPSHFQVAGTYVTSIATNNGITGGTITTSGTLSLDQSFGAVWTAASSTYTNHLSLNTASTTQLTAPLIWTGLTAFKLLSTDANGQIVASSTIGDSLISSAATWNGKLSVITADAPLSGSGTSGSHLVLSTAGTWSGNAVTATALAANGTNCSAGNYPLGVDASGNAEGCTAAGTGTVTSVTATYPILSTGGTTPVISTALSSSTLTASSPLTGSFAQVGSGGSLGIQAASGSQNGYLSSGDWSLLHTATTTFSAPLSYSVATNAVTCPTCQTAAAILTLGNFASTTGQNISVSTSTFSFNGLTFGQTIGASANSLLFTPTVTGTLSNAGLAHSTIVLNGTTLTLGDAADTITAASSSLLSNNNTFTGLDQFSNATSTLLTAGTFWNTGITSALGLFDASHKETAYAGSNCGSNTFANAESAVGALTCTSVPNAALANSTIGATSPNSTLSFGAAAALGSTFTGDLNLTHSNWWTATQNFGNASSSEFTATSTVWHLGSTFFGSTQQSNISATGVLTLGTALAIGSGGTGQTTQQAALNALAPTPTRAGDVIYYNGSNWTNLAGNNSGTNCFQENSSGVPSFGSCGAGGSQTPWTSAINGGGFALTNAGSITATNFTATSTVLTSTFDGNLVIATTSPNALQVTDAFNTSYLTVNTASTTADIFDVASSTGTNLLAVNQAGLVSETNATSTLFTSTTAWIGTLNLTNPLSIANGGTNQTTFGITNGITAFDGTRFNNFAGYTLTSALLTAANASTTNFTAGSSNLFSVFSTGEVSGFDNLRAVSGQISPMRYLSFKLSSSTAWAATSSAASPYADAAVVVMPFAGTLRTLSCWTNVGTLEISATVNGGTTNYQPASTTAGIYTLSSTFTQGATTTIIAGNPATSPTFSSCTMGVTQTI